MKNGPYELVIAPPEYPGKRYRGRYVYEHHLVWWRHTGELVPDGSVIHHKNDQKRDNRFENFELKTNSAHSIEHGRARARPLEQVHGTLVGYQKRKCRCSKCRAASTRAQNEWRWRTGRRKKRLAGSQAGKAPSCYLGDAQVRDLPGQPTGA